MFTLRAVGQFELLDAAGVDRSPRSRKACGVLALLALAPGLRRSRTWLQAMLWSDRGGEQAAASLRQALRNIRQHLGSDRAVLRSDRLAVSLDAVMLGVSFEPPIRPLSGQSEAELFEDIDIADPKFRTWIQHQRQAAKTYLAVETRKPLLAAEALRWPAIVVLTACPKCGGNGEHITSHASGLASHAIQARGDVKSLRPSEPQTP
ncbi:hypothetical protein DA102_010145 [Sinorhizobium meliloti]|nr:hypothetical protein DA102_010145 [Sinorhizobium meliloti]